MPQGSEEKKSIEQLVEEIATEAEKNKSKVLAPRPTPKLSEQKKEKPQAPKIPYTPTVLGIPHTEEQTASVQPQTQPKAITPPQTQQQKPPPILPPFKKPDLMHKKGVNIPYVDLSQKIISKRILNRVPEYIARLYQAVPIDEEHNKLVVAMVDPEDYQAIEFIKKKTSSSIKPVLASASDVAHILDQYSVLQSEVEKAIKSTGIGEEEKKEKTEDTKEVEEAPTSRIVFSMIKKAVLVHSSDIHIEPNEDEVVVRYRIDGILQKVLSLPKAIQASIISRIKILSNMKIDETRLPQDGRFELQVHKRDVDFRVSTFPTVHGEKVVMRILDKSTGILTLEQLGLEGVGFKRVKSSTEKSHGMILVTGPTGSGKTTTLYAILDRIMSEKVNIVTMEDPVEYQIKGINQGQVKVDIGFTFAKGLRSIVRQDPDIIMVGEIRDLETAQMAVHAALTGHIVLSTLHTNDAAGAIPRLVDMGIEPFLITSSLCCVIGQRLTRLICPKCKQEINLAPEIIDEIKKEIEALPSTEKDIVNKKPFKFYQGKGCRQCNKTGYKGRIGAYEVLEPSEKIVELTLKKSGASQIMQQALIEGMITMKQDGIIKALDGKTTIEEVWRVTKE